MARNPGSRMMKRATILTVNLTLLLSVPGLVAAQQTSPQQGQVQGQSQPQMQGQPQGQRQSEPRGQAQGQMRDRQPMGTPGGQPMVGSRLMTPEEREQLQERMRSAGSPEERQAIMDEHRLKMADRARAQGRSPEEIEGLPSSSGDDPRSRKIRGQPNAAPQGAGSGPASAAGQASSGTRRMPLRIP